MPSTDGLLQSRKNDSFWQRRNERKDSAFRANFFVVPCLEVAAPKIPNSVLAAFQRPAVGMIRIKRFVQMIIREVKNRVTAARQTGQHVGFFLYDFILRKGRFLKDFLRHTQ